MASHAAFRAPLGRQLGTRSTCRSSSSPSLRAALVPARRGAARSARRVVALDRSREGGLGGDDGAMDTNVLYERMRALQAKEASENSAIVEAAIEKDQAIVAGIRGDAAERPTPEPGAFDALIEHILSTPMEAMDYEGVRCAPLLTKAFSAHIDLRAREAASRGTEEGDETVAELTLLAAWVTEQRERQEERDDAERRRRLQSKQSSEGVNASDASNVNTDSPETGTSDEKVSYPTPLRTAGDKFAVLMAAASRGVDALRDEIVDMAKKKEVDDALMAILTGNAANAEAEGDEGRAKFLYKVAEVCLREKKNAGSDRSSDDA